MNNNIHLSEGNIKSKNTDKIAFLTWSLPSHTTCPYATELCKKHCFDKKDENFDGVRKSRERNLEETKKDTFSDDMITVIDDFLNKPKYKSKIVFVRIHTSGDFYNIEYFNKWISITDNYKGNPRILFQAYTKSMPILLNYVKSNRLSDVNIHFVWSVWDDTKDEYTKLAERLGLQKFTALPKDEIQKEVDGGAFLCRGDCGNCRECYTGSSRLIVIPYH